MLRRNFALSAVMLAAAIGVTAPLASAAQNYKGAFNLPVATYLGGTLLEPGEYNVSIDSSQPGSNLLRVSGNGKLATVFLGPTEQTAYARKGSLVMVEVNGMHAITQFTAGSLGKSFSFALPKQLRTELAKGGATSETEVSIH